MLRRRIQLALLHVAVTLTAVPIESVLSRIMIKELALPATLVAILAAFPYIFSPVQVGIGSFTDRHPLRGRRRTPAIILGIILCAVGLGLTPYAAYLFPVDRLAAAGLSLLAFGAWGIGFNVASVSYFSLASELSGEKGRSRTIAIMFFLMIVSIIATSIVLSRLLEPYSRAALERAFLRVAAAALLLGFLGVIGLEQRAAGNAVAVDRTTMRERAALLARNPQALRFFTYLLLMLVPLLGQDILLSPFGGLSLGMSVRESTGISSVWGTFTLLGLVLAGLAEGRVNKRLIVTVGGAGAAVAYIAIIAAGYASSRAFFYSGVSVLGLATGLATVSNLSLMLDMTSVGRVCMFMGAWGMADSLARLVGNVLSGGVRDAVSRMSHDPVLGYTIVFGLMALMLILSLAILPGVDAVRLRGRAEVDHQGG
jgi:BCD family chlorophyll transporter-like MFS transporter